jgi:ADP-ribosylglycohydrolase
MSLPPDHDIRLERVRLCLDGLSLGDAFGEKFFDPIWAELLIAKKQLPPKPWPYTDDTAMALGIVEVLEQRGRIDQDLLAQVFARNYRAAPQRGYGSTAHTVLRRIGEGVPWREASQEAFHGHGSMGNGGAMRAAVVGAYFADDLTRAAEEAKLSAEVTHLHTEGIAGAVAVAVAAGWAWQWREYRGEANPAGMLHMAMKLTPGGDTQQGIIRAADLPLDEWEFHAANALGNGESILAKDTVPFCLWCAAAHLDNFAEALWTAVRVGGDIDTNCAIIGGIVALAVGREGLPEKWFRFRERL